MTRLEARAILKKAFPDRTFSIHVIDWHYPVERNIRDKPGDRVEFSVAVQPGFDGDKCSQTDAPTLDGAVKKLLAKAKGELAEPIESLETLAGFYDRPLALPDRAFQVIEAHVGTEKAKAIEASLAQ